MRIEGSMQVINRKKEYIIHSHYMCICMALIMIMQACFATLDEEPPQEPDSSKDQQKFQQLKGDLSEDTKALFSEWLVTEGINSMFIGQLIYYSLLPGWQSLVAEGEEDAEPTDDNMSTKGWIKLTLPCHEELNTAQLVLYSTFSDQSTQASLWGEASQCSWDGMTLDGDLHFVSVDQNNLFMKINGKIGYDIFNLNDRFLYMGYQNKQNKKKNKSEENQAVEQLGLLWENKNVRWLVQLAKIEDIEKMNPIDRFVIVTEKSEWECSFIELECQNISSQEIIKL